MLGSPISPGLSIEWNDTIEWLPIHPQHELPVRFETFEYWHDGKRLVTYHPQVKQTRLAGEVRYRLTYKKMDHPDLTSDDVRWGTSTIVIKNGSSSARVDWADEDPRYSGSAEGALIEQGERARGNARPTIRNQSPLRNFLLNYDKACSITGEDTHSALECAHILAVKDGGFESYRNAFLLRADLHCLYDNGDFDITPDGTVVIRAMKLSKNYRDILSGRKLDDKLKDRLANSLTQRPGKT